MILWELQFSICLHQICSRHAELLKEPLNTAFSTVLTAV